MGHRKKDTSSQDWATYRRLLRYVRPYRSRLAGGFACGLMFALANGAMLYPVHRGLGDFFSSTDTDAWKIGLLVAAFPVIALIRGAADFGAAYLIRWVGNRVVKDLRDAMFHHIHGLSVSYFTQSRTGDLISRTANDTVLIEHSVSATVTGLAKQPVTLLCLLGWMIYIDYRLAFVSLVVFPICLWPIASFGRKVRRYTRQSQERIADVISFLSETIAGVRIVKAFGMQEDEAERFRARTDAFFGRIMRVTKSSAIVEPIIVVIAAGGISLVLLYVRMVEMSVAEFFTFVGALLLMYEPVKKLSKIHINVQASSAAADRIFEVLDTKPSVVEREDAIVLAEEIETIAFKRAEFSYGEDPVLRGIDLDVKAGERVAFVGSSGAGKTSLVNLVPRFYDLTSGELLINGCNIRDFTLASLRARIGLVTQETFLFNDTVRANIAYGARSQAQADVEAAAQQAYAHEFITALPEGYDTVVGERGVRLSGGQRQRLAIARAIMRNPPVLILDEATSALDTESERMVQAALDKAMQGRTVFAIAHRLSTITKCDRIVVLQDGRIVEQGTHQALLDHDGVYKRLYNLQFEV